MRNLNKTLTKSQKELLFNIIRKTIMDDSNFVPTEGYTKRSNFNFLRRISDGATKSTWAGGHYFFHRLNDFNEHYSDLCVEITISHISVLPCWFGKDKDIKNSTKSGWHRTKIIFVDKVSNNKFDGLFYSIPNDLYQFLLNEGKIINQPIPEPKPVEPDYSSILIKADNCISTNKKYEAK